MALSKSTKLKSNQSYVSTGPNGWKHVRCARENETAPDRQKLPGPVLFFLNYKPEYVPNTICKPGIYATFSNKKFSPFGRPVLDGVDYSDKSIFNWISAIRLPDFVSKTDFEWAVTTATKKKKLDCSSAELLTVDEGMCVQINMSLLSCASGQSAWRGNNYYLNRKVKVIKRISSSQFQGEASGSNGEIYDVFIDVEHPRKSSCTCPHAAGKRIVCKQQIALFFDHIQIIPLWINHQIYAIIHPSHPENRNISYL